MNWHVLSAIFKRNFISYFSSPTGYVFICVFVALTSVAAFFPYEFFNANLANLDQLNLFFPAIMLVFVPAITMSVWAEERRQGTDELLLTIPASDLDVVLGKFLASLAIYSVALAFSMISNYAVLAALGRPDVGLFLSTYMGYWFIGMTMISVGMVASFLTNNLTVGFILGAIFNAPLVISVYADTIIRDTTTAQAIKQWSMMAYFRNFERGVISLSSIVYFVTITAVMLYLAMVLIGRRHWMGGRDGHSMAGHYIVRTLALIVAAVGVTTVFANHDRIRYDITTEQLSSLSDQSRKLLKELDTKYPVVVEAYISPQVPAEYIQTRLDLLSMLDEINATAGDKVRIHKYIIENLSEEASLAEKKHGIRPQTVASKSRGQLKQEEFYLGVAFSCGLEKEVLPFIDKGLPAEYELVRSICVVAEEKRPKIGLLKTEAQLMGGFNMQNPFAPREEQQIVAELKKQYEVVEVDANQPIDPDQYKMLLAVQPSSLTQPEMTNFVNAVRDGLPTAVFEDPFPLQQFWPNVTGTSQPRPPQQGFMGMQQPSQPKGKISDLWDAIGVDMIGDEIVWQEFNPYPKIPFDPELVFIAEGSGNRHCFSESDRITSGLQQILLLYPGSYTKQPKSKLKYEEICLTGVRSGTLGYNDLIRSNQRGGLDTLREQKKEEFALAIHVRGKPPKNGPSVFDKFGSSESENSLQGKVRLVSETHATEGDAKEGDAKSAEAGGREVNVVLVADIDCLSSEIFHLRARGTSEDDLIKLNLQNVTFVLNTVDSLAGDTRFIEIRKRNRIHRTLDAIDNRTETARTKAAKAREESSEKFEQARAEAQREFSERVQAVRKRTDLSEFEKEQQVGFIQQHGQRGLDARVEELVSERKRNLEQVERDLNLQVRSVQDGYKLWAVLLPPIPPLLLAFFVYFHRRNQEREGVSKSRLK